MFATEVARHKTACLPRLPSNLLAWFHEHSAEENLFVPRDCSRLKRDNEFASREPQIRGCRIGRSACKWKSMKAGDRSRNSS